MKTDSLNLERTVALEYARPERLETRVDFYDRFRVSGANWAAWLLARVLTRPGLRIADLGCGSGRLWSQHPLPADTHIMLVDKFDNMLSMAKKAVGDAQEVDFQLSDLDQGWPLSGLYDVILAAHIIYHLQNKSKFIISARGSLAPAGRLFVTMPSSNHLTEVYQILAELGVERGDEMEATEAQTRALMAENFPTFDCVEYEADLFVDDIDALSSFVASFRPLHQGLLDTPKGIEAFKEAACTRFVADERGRRGLTTRSCNLLLSAEV